MRPAGPRWWIGEVAPRAGLAPSTVPPAAAPVLARAPAASPLGAASCPAALAPVAVLVAAGLA
eukprot:3771365-Pyramimonas_sp.AAC.1